jgi:hypothetical protein
MYDNLMMDPLLVALRDDIAKWEFIRDSKLGFRAGTYGNNLCDIVRLDCVGCPLEQIGRGCLEENSSYLEYAKLIDDLHSEKPSEVVLKYTPQFFQDKVRPVIRQIIKDLKEAEQQFLLRESEK